MVDMVINQGLFDAIGREEAEKVAATLSSAGFFPGEKITITGSPDVSPPAENSEVFGMNYGVQSITKFPCYAFCDATAAAATAAVATSNPVFLAGALAIIAAAREECRRRC